MSQQNSTGTEIKAQLAAYRERFNLWRRKRPFPGGTLLILGGILTAWIPLQLASDLMLVGRMITGIGLLWAALMITAGVFALQFPRHSSKIGIVGVVVSILSLFGALGGLVVGMVFGILGGNLCYGWHVDEELAAEVHAEQSGFSWEADDGTEETSSSESDDDRIDSVLNRIR